MTKLSTPTMRKNAKPIPTMESSKGMTAAACLKITGPQRGSAFSLAAHVARARLLAGFPLPYLGYERNRGLRRTNGNRQRELASFGPFAHHRNLAAEKVRQTPTNRESQSRSFLLSS
jgi:hypothetical protein